MVSPAFVPRLFGVLREDSEMPACAFWQDQRGNTTILAAMVLMVMVGFTAFGIDVTKFYSDRRRAQSTVDLAAMSAASNIAAAPTYANATVAKNGLSLSAPLDLQYGIYTPDSTLSPAARFQPASAAAANAVRLTLKTQTQTFFGRALIGKSSVPIQVVATAAASTYASFAIGSRLVTLDGGLLNQILGALLGANLTLSAMDYQSLINANVSVFDFMNAAAIRGQVTGPTYASLLDAQLTPGAVIDAMMDAQRNNAVYDDPALVALSSIKAALPSSSQSVSLSALINAGPYAQLSLGQTPQNAGSLSLFDLVNGIAQVSNGQHQVAVSLDLQVPGIASATLNIAIGERPVGSSWFAIGTQGASVHTAQTRVLLDVRVQGIPPTSLLDVPVYVEIAEGTATLNGTACGYPDQTSSSVTLGVSPGIVNAWIGSVSSTDFTNFSWPVSPGMATLASVGLLTVQGQAHVTMSNTTPTPVTFSYADIAAANKKTVSTSSFSSSLIEGLLGDLDLGASIGSVNVNLPPLVSQSVAGSLGAVASPLDQKLSSILAILGIGLGQADTWVSGLRCGGAVLVN